MVRIKELRLAQGWTQTQLGKRIGVVKTTISGYESGDRQPDPEKICALCDLFQVTADYLLGRSNSPRPAISDEDARLLDAFHAAPPETQAAIRLLILPPVSGKKAVS